MRDGWVILLTGRDSNLPTGPSPWQGVELFYCHVLDEPFVGIRFYRHHGFALLGDQFPGSAPVAGGS